jgi:hypothetical protein
MKPLHTTQSINWLCYVGRQNLFGNCCDALGMILKSDDLE